MIAVLLLLFVLALQLYFAVKTFLQIKIMTKIFPGNKNIERGYFVAASGFEFDSGNSVKILKINESVITQDSFKGIISATNQYLSNNRETTAEYTILRDIAERISQSEENIIEASVSLPLYIGLMGTFAGVIFGLISFKTGINDSSIQLFLQGVLISMSASFAGLFLTTMNNSWFFKKAKAVRDYNKNIYLNFLQSELLPTLENTLGHNIREFKGALTIFNDAFSNNISDFSDTIPAITDNIRLQIEFIKQFQDINIPQLANANIKIMDRLDKSVKIFEGFNEYANNLNKSYENYAGNLQRIFDSTDQMLGKVVSVLDRLTDFEDNIKFVGKLVAQSQSDYAKLGEKVAGNLTELQKRWQLVKEFSDKSDSEVINLSNSYISDFKALSEKLQQELSAAFSLTQKDNPFAKLLVLDKIHLSLETMSKKLDKLKPGGGGGNSGEDLKDVIHELQRLRHSIQPSIFKPKALWNFILGRNGYHVNEN